jgi:hypothetical protein
MPRITLTRAALVAALVLGGGGVAAAAIPSGDGSISACYKTSGGAVRVIDAGTACAANETPLKWNQTGPKGATGPAGPQGPAGPSMVRAHYKTGVWYTDTEYETIAWVNMPKGKHHVSAKATVYISEMLGEHFAAVNCRLYQDPGNGAQMIALDQSQVEVSDDGPDLATISLEGLANVTTSLQALKLQCKDDGGVGGMIVRLEQVKLFAQEIGGYSTLID